MIYNFLTSIGWYSLFFTIASIAVLRHLDGSNYINPSGRLFSGDSDDDNYFDAFTVGGPDLTDPAYHRGFSRSHIDDDSVDNGPSFIDDLINDPINSWFDGNIFHHDD